MRMEDLNQVNLQSRDLSVHEDACQIKLHLEADVDVGSTDGRTPPKRKATIRNLVPAGSLRIRQLLVSHAPRSRMLSPRRDLREPSQSVSPIKTEQPLTLPGGEAHSLEKSVLQNTFNTSQCSYDINSMVVQLP